MTNLQTLMFYATPEHDCSYLPDKKATTMFVDPKAKVNQALYSELSRFGFRRSGNHYYRPHCNDCQACIPIRIPTNLFKPSRSQKRVIAANRDTIVQEIKPDFHDDHYLVYEKYILERHKDGDMYPPSRDQYRSFLVEGQDSTRFLEFSLNEKALGAANESSAHEQGGHKVVGIAVVDELVDGLSAIYTFFDPDYEHLSLGSYAVLWQIQEAARRHLPYVYLGYFIRDCRKMNYKTKFRPYEARIEERWLSETQLMEILEQSSNKS